MTSSFYNFPKRKQSFQVPLVWHSWVVWTHLLFLLLVLLSPKRGWRWSGLFRLISRNGEDVVGFVFESTHFLFSSPANAFVGTRSGCGLDLKKVTRDPRDGIGKLGWECLSLANFQNQFPGHCPRYESSSCFCLELAKALVRGGRFQTKMSADSESQHENYCNLN